MSLFYDLKEDRVYLGSSSNGDEEEIYILKGDNIDYSHQFQIGETIWCLIVSYTDGNTFGRSDKLYYDVLGETSLEDAVKRAELIATDKNSIYLRCLDYFAEIQHMAIKKAIVRSTEDRPSQTKWTFGPWDAKEPEALLSKIRARVEV